MIRSLVRLLTAVPLLVGCSTTLDTPAQKVAAPPPAQVQTPLRLAKKLNPIKPAAVPKASELTYLDIKALRGETSYRVTTLLGAPDFRRADKPAELWQYRHDKCSVDLFLYPRDGGGLSVDFLDVRTYGDQNLSLQACFVAILKAKANAGERG